MTLNHLGYSPEALQRARANRELPFFAKVNKDSERSALLQAWQARVFTQAVRAGHEHLYRLSIALKEFALSPMVQIDPKAPPLFSGVMYPAVAMWLLGDNVAILPSEVDAKMKMFEVILLTLESVDEAKQPDGGTTWSYNIRAFDHARPDLKGNLIWGQRSQIVHPPGVDASQFPLRVLAPQ